MGKPNKLGYQKPYTPNSRADFRSRKRGRNPADRVKAVAAPIKKEE